MDIDNNDENLGYDAANFHSTKKASIFVIAGIKLLFVVAAIIVLVLDDDGCGHDTYDLYNVLLTYTCILGVDVFLTIPWLIYLNKVNMTVQGLIYYGIF